MKKWLALLCACALLAAAAGCRKQPDDVPAPAPADDPPAQTEQVNLYLPDGQAMYVIPTPMSLTTEDDMAPVLVNALISQGALPVGVEVKGCTIENGQIALDLNGAFADADRENGTAAETMLLASVVDTFLDYYDAQALTLTADGVVIETGHAIYDEPFTALFEIEDAQAAQ